MKKILVLLLALSMIGLSACSPAPAPAAAPIETIEVDQTSHEQTTYSYLDALEFNDPVALKSLLTDPTLVTDKLMLRMEKIEDISNENFFGGVLESNKNMAYGYGTYDVKYEGIEELVPAMEAFLFVKVEDKWYMKLSDLTLEQTQILVNKAESKEYREMYESTQVKLNQAIDKYPQLKDILGINK